MVYGDPIRRGRDGTHIREFGLAARTCRLGWVLESVSSEVLDGAGITGDAIGVAVSQLLAAAGITRGATRFITGTLLPGRRFRCAAELQPRRTSTGRRHARRSFQPFRRKAQAFQRKHPGGSRIRCTPRSEWHPLGRLQRLRAGRTGKKLFVTRKFQLRWRRIPWRRGGASRGGGGGGSRGGGRR